MAGNTAFIDALCRAVVEAGGVPEPLFCSSLRNPDDELVAVLREADVLVTTVLAAGGSRPAAASAGQDDESWDTGALAALDVPILQALCLTRTRDEWRDDDGGVSPLDAANQVAVPEFDGRIVTVPFSFKETDACRSTSPTPSGPRGWPGWRSRTGACATSRTPRRRSPWC
jgi:cobaltochelatase CobN